MRRPPAHTMRRQDEWGTPAALFSELDEKYHFTLDPCATAKNAKCPHFYTAAEDGLSMDWSGEVVFMNPPFSCCAEWVAKARAEASKGAMVVCLLPARVDTAWWHEHVVDGGAEIAWIRGSPLRGRAAQCTLLVGHRDFLAKQVGGGVNRENLAEIRAAYVAGFLDCGDGNPKLIPEAEAEALRRWPEKPNREQKICTCGHARKAHAVEYGKGGSLCREWDCPCDDYQESK